MVAIAPINRCLTIKVNGGDMLATLIGDWSTLDEGGALTSNLAIFDRNDLTAIEFDSSRQSR